MPEPVEGRTELRRSNWLPIGIAIAVIVAGAAGWWFWSRGSSEQAAPPAPAGSAAEAAPGATPGASQAGAAATDAAGLHALFESVSPNAALRRWLSDTELVRRWVVVTDNLALGATPRKALSFLAPREKLSVTDRGGRQVISPESYARYDFFGDAVASVDARAAAQVYAALHPALDAAYQALGYPGASIDEATARALGRLEAAPVPEGDVSVVDEGGIWVFQDPKLERLDEVEKHLLRMGPRNARLVQAKARELREALSLPPVRQVAAQKR